MSSPTPAALRSEVSHDPLLSFPWPYGLARGPVVSRAGGVFVNARETASRRLRDALQSIAVLAVRAQDESGEALEETLNSIECDLEMARSALAGES
jgi:hypothetical protein